MHRGAFDASPYSPFVRFILASRPVLLRLCETYKLPVGAEALFVCTILHAADHTSCDIHTRGHLLRHEKLPSRGWFNVIALQFYRPAQHFMTNLLRDRKDETPLYRDLYTELSKLDPAYADCVTLSISY